MPAKKLTERALVALLTKNLPDGWTADPARGYLDSSGDLWKPGGQQSTPDAPCVLYARTAGDVHAQIALNVGTVGKYEKDYAFGGWRVEGHTIVNGGCFTRIGVDVSSCELVDREDHHGAHTYGSINTLLQGEWERCKAAVARKKTAEPVPSLPFTRQPEWFIQAAADLRAKKSVTLMPHGFGTGYYLRPKNVSRWATRADSALEQRLGVSPIYVETFDAD